MSKAEQQKTMNLPNILTMSRIVAIIFFVVMASLACAKTIGSDAVFSLRLSAYILAIIAGATDILDGYLARKLNQVTNFGALMDPLADKVFVSATMLMAVEYKLMPAWIAIAVLSREFMVTGLRTLAANNQVIISADKWGKIKTASQMIMLIMAGACWTWNYDLQSAIWCGIRLWYIWIAYLSAVVLITILSGVGYFVRYRHLFMQSR